jgi:hypothetical protein
MRSLFLLAATAALSAVAVAQSPLTTTFANNNGGAVGGGVYFDLTVNVPISITGVDMNLSAGSGTLEIWTLVGMSRTGNQTNQAAWTMAATGTATSAGPGAPTPVTLSNPIPLAPGLVGITYVARTGVSHFYTNGNGSNQNYSTVELALAAGEASNAAFTAPLFTPRVVNTNINYTVTGSGTVAQRINYGTGGGRQFASTYELFAAAASFDLNGTNFQFTEQAGGGWVIGPGPGPVSATNATVIPLTDDSEAAQTLMSGFAPSSQICSNGFISFGGSNGTAFTPDVATFLNATFESFRIWHDLNPGAAGSGQVKYEFVGGEDVVTWDGVYSFGTTTPNTFQLRMSGTPGSRIFRCCIVQMSGVGNAILVGYSPAGPSADPGNIDISMTGTARLAATDTPAVALAASARPLIGTTITLDTTNEPAGTLGGVTLFSAIQNLAGLDLSILGAPGNRLYLGSIDISLPLDVMLAIPNSNNLLGGALHAQSAIINLAANPLGVLTSNGVRLIFGNL